METRVYLLKEHRAEGGGLEQSESDWGGRGEQQREERTGPRRIEPGPQRPHTPITTFPKINALGTGYGAPLSPSRKPRSRRIAARFDRSRLGETRD